MRAYMYYSRSGGSEEGAILVFANTAREAGREGWGTGHLMIVDEYIDGAVRWLRDKDWLFEEADKDKLAAGIAHVIDDPRSCSACYYWGLSPIGERGYCEECVARWNESEAADDG
ncbi:hypothetical protein LCGC14_1670470 [marine sediment metagenome]|uniref:Uncharacterized protein n=1 Tax=marine sediment metagenome TaxID=412755 RepID=A0A0F9HRG7_9ZZZZ